MAEDRPIPAEQEALDRPWRMWASIGVGSFALVAIVLGFILLPLAEGRGAESLFYSICRAIGIPGFGPTPADAGRTVPAEGTTVAPPSQLAWTAATRRLILSGDRERGAALVAQTCVGCHGEDGIGLSPSFPNVGAQSASAMFKQLHDFRSGSRSSGQAAVMTSIVAALDDQQLADVAAFYAAVPPRRMEPAASAVPLEIERLARRGDIVRRIPSCDSCHGGALVGPEGALVLLGQSAPYIEQQLQLFASGERDNDLYGRMRDIAARLTPEEMRQLAMYYGGITISSPE